MGGGPWHLLLWGGSLRGILSRFCRLAGRFFWLEFRIGPHMKQFSYARLAALRCDKLPCAESACLRAL